MDGRINVSRRKPGPRLPDDNHRGPAFALGSPDSQLAVTTHFTCFAGTYVDNLGVFLSNAVRQSPATTISNNRTLHEPASTSFEQGLQQLTDSGVKLVELLAIVCQGKGIAPPRIFRSTRAATCTNVSSARRSVSADGRRNAPSEVQSGCASDGKKDSQRFPDSRFEFHPT